MMKKSYFTIAALLFLTACAGYNVHYTEMLPMGSVYNSIDANPKLSNAVEVGNVHIPNGKIGGYYTQITPLQFREALNNALLMAGLSKRGQKGTKYILDASFHEIDYPMNGFTLSIKVISKISYKLRRKSDNKIVYSETITLPYTAKFGEAFDGVQRQRIATAKSVRENITHLIRVLSKKEFE